MALFENYDRRIDKINGVLKQYGIESVEACREMCQAKGFDPYEIVKSIQPICFENASDRSASLRSASFSASAFASAFSVFR